MIIHGVKQRDQASVYGIWPVFDSSGSNQAGSFRQSFTKQLKEHYQGRVIALFDEIDEQAARSFTNMDLANFEKYLSLIKDLVNEVVGNAFALKKECVWDKLGRQRIYSTVSIIDERLDELATDIIDRHIERITFISRIDEIRGLIMDMLL